MSAVQVVRGHRGRDKLVRIVGLTIDDVASRLAGVMETLQSDE
jgi:uncharacterized protein YggU (UPF0235/DUF167 family)